MIELQESREVSNGALSRPGSPATVHHDNPLVFAAFICFAIVGGCADQAIVSEPAGPLGTYLTEQARHSLDASGRFVLPTAGADTLSAREGTELAQAFVRTFGVMLESAWSYQAGVEVRASRLHQCGRPFLTRSIYEDTPIAPDVVRIAAGPHWIVSMCDGETGAFLTVSVSALARGLIASLNLARDGASGGFDALAYAPVLRRMPTDPEDAAMEVARRTGLRVASVPTLIQPALPWMPARAMWRVEVERSVRLRGAKDSQWSTSNVLYVGLNEDHTAIRVSRPYVGGDALAFAPTLRMKAQFGLRVRNGLTDQLEDIVEISP